MNEDREEFKARELGNHYGRVGDAFREAGRIRGREMAESMARIAATFAGIRAGLDEAGTPRACDAGRLDIDTAHECAMVEYVWRMCAEAAVKGRLRWKEIALRNGRELVGTEQARAALEKDRDAYRKLCEERGDLITDLNNSLAQAKPWYTNAAVHPAVATAEQAREERDQWRRLCEERGEQIMELNAALVKPRTGPHVRRGEAGRLDIDTAWECAHVEQSHTAALDLALEANRALAQDAAMLRDELDESRSRLEEARSELTAGRVAHRLDLSLVNSLRRDLASVNEVLETVLKERDSGVRIGNPGPPLTGDTVMVATGRRGAWDVTTDAGAIGYVVEVDEPDVSYAAYTKAGRHLGRFTYANSAMTAVRRVWG